MPSLLTRSAVGLVLLAATAAPAGARGAPAPGSPRDRGKVRYVTARRAYLDAGKLDGLKLGDAVELVRNGRKAALCRLDQLADHTASCAADARVGDSFALPMPPTPPPPAPPPRAQSTAPVDPTAAQTALAAAPVEKVDFKRTGAALGSGALPLVTASIGHTAFVTIGGGQFEQERIDVAVNGLNMRFGGFRGFAHLTALVYSQRPAAVRFRAGDIFQLYVWDFEASSREVGRPFVASVGRVWTYHTPGLPVVDGAQIGWRSQSGDAEAGVVGGTIPQAMTLYPSAQWLGGLYYGAMHASARRKWLRLLRHEARLSMRETVANGPLLELEALAQAWVHRSVDIGADARASMGAGDWSTPHFDAGYASIGIHPDGPVRGFVGFRYLDSRIVDPDALAPSFLSTGRWYHADADLVYSPRPWVSLSLQGGAAERLQGLSLGRQYVGGELTFPLLLRGLGGVSAGYREELGWMSGRTAYVGLTMALRDRLRLVYRASFFDDLLAANSEVREVGLYAMLDARLYRWLSLRTSALSRVQVTPNTGGSANVGLVARVDLTGSW